jgi:hypothetical protein
MKPRIEIDEMAGSVRESRLAQAVRGMGAICERALRGSQTYDAIGRLPGMIRQRDVAAVVAFAGLVLVLAMATHIGLLLFVDPSTFPSHAALAVPGGLLIVGVLALVMRRGVAAAWRER